MIGLSLHFEESGYRTRGFRRVLGRNMVDFGREYGEDYQKIDTAALMPRESN